MIKKLLGVVMLVGFMSAMVSVAEEAAKVDAPKILAVKDGVAQTCACKADCKCTVKADDPTKCSCGKDVVKVALKGKFVCEKCCVVADKAGKCVCGTDLQEVK